MKRVKLWRLWFTRDDKREADAARGKAVAARETRTVADEVAATSHQLRKRNGFGEAIRHAMGER